jgi:hypothetical protein
MFQMMMPSGASIVSAFSRFSKDLQAFGQVHNKIDIERYDSDIGVGSVW